MKIFVLADGTWLSNNSYLKSNIFELKNILNLDKSNKVIYQSGIGTQSNYIFNPANIINGAIALDIDTKITDLYKQLIQVYKPGDTLYFVGYSRGAYIIRCLAGLIYNCGLPSSDQLNYINKEMYIKTKDCCTTINLDLFIKRAYSIYRNRKEDYNPDSSLCKNLRQLWSSSSETNIELLCCFDTVGTLGIPPIPMLNLPATYRFFNTNINKNIKYALHLLAKDENRVILSPTLMTKSLTNDITYIEQKLYVGNHSTIGGIDKDNLYLSKLPFYYLCDKLQLSIINPFYKDLNYKSSYTLFDFGCLFIGGIKDRQLTFPLNF